MLLQTQQLSHTYVGARKMQFPDIAIAESQQWLLLGPSGSGKTTLLSLLGGLLPVGAGQIWWNEKLPVHTLRGKALDQFRAAHLGIVFQLMHFAPALNVLDNILLANRMAGLAPNIARAEGLAKALAIESLLLKQTFQCSSGEQQRISIARALMNQPQLLLCDEPTAALDDANAMRVGELLLSQSVQQGTALLVITHDKRLKMLFEHQIQL